MSIYIYERETRERNQKKKGRILFYGRERKRKRPCVSRARWGRDI